MVAVLLRTWGQTAYIDVQLSINHGPLWGRVACYSGLFGFLGRRLLRTVHACAKIQGAQAYVVKGSCRELPKALNCRINIP